jgi:hypothetical protein
MSGLSNDVGNRDGIRAVALAYLRCPRADEALIWINRAPNRMSQRAAPAPDV